MVPVPDPYCSPRTGGNGPPNDRFSAHQTACDEQVAARRRVIPGGRVEEGLRLTAAMLGMDYLPKVVFLDNGVEILLPDALYKNNLKDYLMVMSEMAGIYVLEESLNERELTLADLEQGIVVTLVNTNELAELAKSCTLITSF